MTFTDTDVLIDFLAEREPAAKRVARELESGNLSTTVITWFKMLSGASRLRKKGISAACSLTLVSPRGREVKESNLLLPRARNAKI